jgi:hypothetical protein
VLWPQVFETLRTCQPASEIYRSLLAPDLAEQRLGVREKLRLDIGVATTSTQQSDVAMQDIVLTLLQRADELCEIAEDTGADMSKLSGAI